jgi:hypothetical protein
MEKESLENFVDGMMDASDMVVSRNPDYLIAPMMGSVPFIDIMTMVNDDFDPSKVVYMPASSRIPDVKDVILNWYGNFLDDKVKLDDDFPEILNIDEVVSGQSLVRCMKSMDIAAKRKRKEIRHDLMGKVFSKRFDVADEGFRQIDEISGRGYSSDIFDMVERHRSGAYLTDRELAKRDGVILGNILRGALSDKLLYRSIGIEDDKKKGKRSKEYRSLKDGGNIFPVPVNKILTMDRPHFCSAKYKEFKNDPVSENPYVVFSPEISHFEITPEYLNFLQGIAKYIGKDPNKVGPVNFAAILDSKKYLS